MLVLKLHKAQDGRVLACVSDQSLLGKLYEEGEKQLDLRGDFFKGEPKTNAEIGDIIRNADFVYLTGEEAIKLGIEENIILQENIVVIANIPHAQAIVDQS